MVPTKHSGLGQERIWGYTVHRIISEGASWTEGLDLLRV